MANSSIAITAGTGTPVDTFQEAGGDHRQAIVIASPTTTAAATEVTNAVPSTTDYGLVARLAPAPSTSHLVAAGSTNATNVKASAGTLLAVHAYNLAATPRYIKFHNTAGTPTAGASVVLTVALEAGTSRDVVFPQGGRPFSTGIAFTMVTGIADADANAVTASDLVVDVEYA